MKRIAFVRATAFGLLAGFIAIFVNTMLLFAEDWIPLVTAHGGLLKLFTLYFTRPLVDIGVVDFWTSMNLPGADTAVFKSAFHILVGLAMALLYAYILEPFLVGRAWVKGLIYAVAVWLANALVVLPLIGEGVAGSRHLSLSGIVYFAIAHTIFFVLLAVLYARLTTRR